MIPDAAGKNERAGKRAERATVDTMKRIVVIIIKHEANLDRIE